MGKPAAYHKMSIAQKQAMALGAARPRAVMCPQCDTQIMPVDLIPHLQTPGRCSGPREPGPGDQWLTWGEAVELVRVGGLSEMALSRWAQRGEVRFRGARLDRKYLLRDLVLLVARQLARPRR